ncbi:hypothetical protein FHG87_014225 [Trinorchestia longiramus]|nr:hypothetical protein FHG87_014225 [Trinorchestia longiramus]
MATGVPWCASMWFFAAVVHLLLLLSVSSIPAPKLLSRIPARGVYANLIGLANYKKASSATQNLKTEKMVEVLPHFEEGFSSRTPKELPSSSLNNFSSVPPLQQQQRSSNFEATGQFPSTKFRQPPDFNTNSHRNADFTTTQQQQPMFLPSWGDYPGLEPSNTTAHIISALQAFAGNRNPRVTLTAKCGQILRDELCPAGGEVTVDCSDCTIDDFMERFCQDSLNEPSESATQNLFGFAGSDLNQCEKYYMPVIGKKEELLQQLHRAPHCRISITTLCPKLDPNEVDYNKAVPPDEGTCQTNTGSIPRGEVTTTEDTSSENGAGSTASKK